MQRNKNIRVRGVRRSEPDIRKLGRALIALAQAQAEADAEATRRAAQRAETETDNPQPANPDTEPGNV
jgi:hypothetical protein